MVGVFKGTTALTGAYKGTTSAREVYVGTTKVRPTTPTPTAQYTDRSQDMKDLVQDAYNQSFGLIDAMIETLYGSYFESELNDYCESDLGSYCHYSLSVNGQIRYGFEITDGGDMTDIIVEPETPGWSDGICIVADFDDMEDSAQYVQGTDLGNDTFSFDMSSYASSYVGKDTVLMFIFK